MSTLPTNDVWTDGDWRYVLPGDEYSKYTGTFSTYDDRGQVEDLTAERIATVHAWWAESPEGYVSVDFACLVELTDGTWAACMAWADTTDWDCQSDVTWKWGRTREDVVTYGLDRSARERLGLALTSDGEVPA